MARRAAPRRYISAQAYYHALRSALSEARGDLAGAADELQLALVYDHESLHLTLELGRVSLSLGRIGKARKMAERARRLGPRSTEAALLGARVARARGDVGGAERILRRAARRERAGISAALTLADLYLDLDRPADAVPLLRRAAEREPQRTEALERLARAEDAQGRRAEAVAALERAVRRAPDRADLRIALTDLYEREARLADAAAMWRGFLDVHPADTEGLRAAVRVELLLDGDSPRLARLLEDANDVPSRRALAVLLTESGRYAEAVQAFDELARLGPLDAHARLLRGTARLALGRRRAALVDLEAVGAEGGPLYEAARRALADALVEGGQPSRAQDALRIAVALRPKASDLIAALARIRAHAGDLAGALATLEEARAQGLAPGPLVRAQADVLQASEGTRAALDFVRTVERAGGVDRPTAQWAIGAVLLASDTPGRAVVPLRAAAQKLPASSAVRVDLARALLDRGPGGEARALTVARAALALAPRDPEVLDVVGRALAGIGDLEHARTFLSRAARLSPRDPTIMEHIGDLEQESGASSAARDAWRASRKAWAGRTRHAPARSQSALRRLDEKLKMLEATR